MTEKEKMELPLLPGFTYRISHEGNNGGLVFYQRGNYAYFLQKYIMYSEGYWDTKAYSLLCNQIELVVEVRHSVELLIKAQEDFDRVGRRFYDRYVVPWSQKNRLEVEGDLLDFKNLVNLIMTLNTSTSQILSHHPSELINLDFYHQLCSYIINERFRRFLLGYAKAVNKQIGRTGSLFRKHFRKTPLITEEEILNSINEVHVLKPNFGDEDFDFFLNSNSNK